jgi:hypothetical protein
VIVYSLVVGAGLAVEAWLLALVSLRGRRRWLKATFAAFVLTFIVNGAAFIGTSEGFLDPAWEAAVLWTLVLAHPLTAILVLTLIHGETVPRQRPAVFALLALAPVVVLLTPSADWAVQHAYEPNLLGGFLIVCLGLALAEPVYERLTSPLFAADSFWLASAVVGLIIGGPIYSLEFQDLGILQSAGSNVAAPIAVALFAYVMFHSEPFPGLRPRRSRVTSAPGEIDPGVTVVFDEARPKYAHYLAGLAARKGQTVLVVGRGGPSAETADLGPEVATMTPTSSAAPRVLGTIAEFSTRSAGGLALLPDTADVVMMSGWSRTQASLLRLRAVCQDTRCSFVVSSSRLSNREKEDLKVHRFLTWTLPDPGEEMEAVLAQSFGPGARQLLEAFCRSRGFRREDLNVEDAEPFLNFMDRAISELGAPAADDAALAGLHAQATAAGEALRAFVDRGVRDLADGDWPSRRSSATDRGILVTAADYWKGKEMDELFAAASDLGDRESLFERARSIFVDQLGEAGEGVLRSELSKLGKRPEDLRREDVARLADRAAVDLVAMADVVDVPQEKRRIQGQVESIRRRLEAIAGGQP